MAEALRTDDAEHDLQEIAYRIAIKESRPLVAEQNVQEIIAKCDFYAGNPQLGTPAPHLGQDYRICHHKR
jgi:plasmid stabilization system protein ParE